ncbi:MAG: transposase [Verrucomicrobia bacterium]|nr:transposase [Verrucomicrobiota bacterium]
MLIGQLAKFPGLKQIACIRKRIYDRGQLAAEEIRYHVTSASRRKLPPKKFLCGIRSHWQIENTLHHVKDRSWSEDKMYSKVPEARMGIGEVEESSPKHSRTLAEKLKWKEESMPKWSAQLLSRPKRTLALMRGL